MFHPFTLQPFNRSTLTQARKGRNPLAHGLTVRPCYVDTHQGEPVLKMLYGVLGTSHINKTKAKAKLDKYLDKRNTQTKGSSNWDLTFLK